MKIQFEILRKKLSIGIPSELVQIRIYESYVNPAVWDLLYFTWSIISPWFYLAWSFLFCKILCWLKDWL